MTLTITRTDTGATLGTLPDGYLALFGTGNPVCSNTLAWAFPAVPARDRRARRRNLAALRRDMRRDLRAQRRPLVITLADGTAREAQRVNVGADAIPGMVCPWCEYACEGTRCPNPVCATQLDASALAERRTAEARQAEHEASQRALSASLDRSRAEADEREAERRRSLRAQAKEAGKCLSCLDRSLRTGSAPKLVKHKAEANCPERKRYEV
jgi:hypothetical protein